MKCVSENIRDMSLNNVFCHIKVLMKPILNINRYVNNMEDIIKAMHCKDCDYRLRCKDCDSVFIGKTNINLHKRLYLHKKKCKNPLQNKYGIVEISY